MASVNKVILVGNLGQDPEVRYTQSGVPVANVSIATTETWNDKNSGEKQEKTEWHRVIFFNRLAEVVGEYMKKGSAMYVEGTLQTRKWQDKDGNDRWTTEIVGRNMQMLGSRGDGGGGGSGGGGAPAPPPAKSGGTKSAPPAAQPADDDDFDDDVPF